MASDSRKFQVGLFVLCAVAIGIAAAIWLGASRYFADEVPMVTYFSESVQGLDPGSDVKYRGVPAGRVESIKIAPDDELIEVLLSIKSDVADLLRQDETLRARLDLAGITGLRYVEIDRHKGEALRKSPILDFEPPCEVLLSAPSSITAITAALSQIYENVMAVDFDGISQDIRATLGAADELLRDARVQRLLSSLAELSESASRVTANVERITESIDVAPTLNELRSIAIETRGFLGEIRNQQIGTQMKTTLSDFGGVARSAQSFLYGLQETVDRLDRSLNNLETLTDDVSRQPSRLLFSKPPKPQAPSAGGRP